MNTYVALCALGAEKILGNEIKHLGFKLISSTAGRVSFSGDEKALYLSNYCLRTADRVYIQMAKYMARNFDELFEGTYNAPWQDVFYKDSRIVVDKVRTHKSKLSSEHTVQSMVQKAIYTKLGDRWHISSLPESGEAHDIRVYIENDEVTVLLDTSGEALHKRGYRTKGGLAPLRESTAAVLLQEMLWRRKTPIHDPFCGSGTIVIEANLYAHNVAPGLGRNFAYESLAFYDADLALELKKQEAAKIRTDVECHITGSDISPEAVEIAQLNAEHSCVMAGRALNLIGSDVHIERPDFIVSDFADLKAPYETGLILTNPPYGERLGDASQAEELYTRMQSLFTDFEGWDMGVITNQKKFQECIGHYASQLKSIKAGNLDTLLYVYKNHKKEGE